MTPGLPVYQAKISSINTTGIFAMSFVEFPANESNFVALARSAARPVKLSLDKQKQVLTGVVLIPDQVIYRNDAQLGEYYLTFTAQDIEKIRDKMMQSGAALRTTTHQHEKPLRDNHLVECWIVEDPKRDKSVALGLGEYPKGTLLASYKVGNAVYWRTQVLTGKVNGFSIEAFFDFKSVTMSKPVVKPGTLPVKKTATPVGAFFRAMAAMLDGDTAAEAKDLATVAKDDATDSGTPVIIFTLADGTEVDVDSDGFCTMADGTQAPPGDHALQDGNTITIGDDGVLVETSEAGQEDAAPAAAPAALTAEQKLAREQAKAKGLVLSAQLAKKPAQTPAQKQIANLKAKIAALEKTPTAAPAAPKVDTPERATAKLKGHERAAEMLRAKYARQNG